MTQDEMKREEQEQIDDTEYKLPEDDEDLGKDNDEGNEN